MTGGLTDGVVAGEARFRLEAGVFGDATCLAFFAAFFLIGVVLPFGTTVVLSSVRVCGCDFSAVDGDLGLSFLLGKQVLDEASFLAVGLLAGAEGTTGS